MKFAERFARLFRGYTQRHGRFTIKGRDDSGKRTGQAVTVEAMVQPEDFEAHVAGSYGIGIIPLTEDDRVHFAAIDIDVYNLKPYDYALQIRELPLVLTTSKSGGLHIWLFSKSGVPAEKAVQFMKVIAAQIGHAGCEIFPKQVQRSGSQDSGNWINLPYFGDTRGAVIVRKTSTGLIQSDGTLEEFLAVAENCAETVDTAWLRKYGAELKTKRADAESAEDWYDGPPCLQRLLVGDQTRMEHLKKQKDLGKITPEEFERGMALAVAQLTSGSRNTVFFNAAQYLYRKYEDVNEVQKALTDVNVRQNFQLPQSEVTALSKGSKKEYAYQCKTPPLENFCDRALCRRRCYGVGSTSADVPVELGGFTKILTDPPQYAFNIDGARVRVEAEDLLNQRRFAVAVFNACTKVWPSMKESKFRDLLSRQWENCDEVEGPPDSDRAGIISTAFENYLQERKTPKREGIISGGAFWMEDDADILFLMPSFRKYLQRERLTFSPREVSNALIDIGAVYRNGGTTVAGKRVRPWRINRLILFPNAYLDEDDEE